MTARSFSPTGTLFIACDHAGYPLKEALLPYLAERFPQLAIKDFGCNSATKKVDYPKVTESLALSMKDQQAAWAILLCGSGVGVCMAANRYPWLRAVHAHEVHLARLSREHNNSNVLCMGARWVAHDFAQAIVDTWLTTGFEERHTHRVRQLGELDASACSPTTC